MRLAVYAIEMVSPKTSRRLMPLTASVALHAALVLLAFATLDWTVMREHVLLLELRELDEPPAPSTAPRALELPKPIRPPAPPRPTPLSRVEAPALVDLPATPEPPRADAPLPDPPATAAVAPAPPPPDAVAATPTFEPVAGEPTPAGPAARASDAPAPRGSGPTPLGSGDFAAPSPVERSATVPSGEPAPRAAPGSAGTPIAALPPGGPTQRAIPRGGYQVRPSYPSSARQLRIEGTTLLGVLVADDGRVAEVVIRQSAGHPDLDRAAADAVRRWRFEPARRGNEAVAMWVEVPVEFRLR